MTLKDWTKSGEYEWHKYHENGKKLSGNKFYDGVLITKTINGDWTFGSYYRQIPKEYTYKQGKLKTKSQAQALARKYMKSQNN